MLKRVLPAFLITLIVVAGCKNEQYNFDALPDTVKSFFTISNEELNIDEAIQFNNESENADTYTWDFGDGTTSTETNPTKTYTSPGSYTVKLTAVGPGGTGNYSVNVGVLDPNAVIDTDKELYFIEYGNPPRAIRKISLVPGSVTETVVSLANRAGVGLAYDSVNDKVYFTDFITTGAGKVWRMNTDGSDMEELVSGINDPYGISINLDGGKIYWADEAGNISRANLDGSSLEREFIKIAGARMRSVAYNSKNDLIYFYDYWLEDIYVANSDGTGVTKIIEDVFGYSFFVDEVNEKIYYEDRQGGARNIMMANLDGSNIVKFADSPATQVFGMAIDYNANKFYWTERDNGLIRRANLDGSEAETFLSGLNSPRGMFIK